MLALELPDEYSQSVSSGEQTFTFQVRDKLAIGDIISIISGNTRRKIRITGKAWVPETEMPEDTKAHLSTKVPKELGFSGAFKIIFDYVDDDNIEKDEKLDLISKHMDKDI